MKKYLTIGAIVQVIIIGVRTALGKTKNAITGLDKEDSAYKISFGIGLVIGLIFNIVLWPIAIIAEIYNTIKGI